jgi:hypothetical protein
MTELAYHFVGDTLRDGSPIPPDGVWEEFDGAVEMCKSGLHASRHPFDALLYAPGPTLRLVEVEQVQQEISDKLVCRRRRTVVKIDATPLVMEFARWCALQVIHLWDAPEVVKCYLETGDESFRDAARNATRAAAGGDAWVAWAAVNATWAAANAAWAAWYAARSAGHAARDAWAAWYAARSGGHAARDAGHAARDAQRAKFKQMVDAAFERK